jgi:hypothetical protein
MSEHTQQMGHQTHLRAALGLGLGSVTLFGLAYMTPIIVLGILVLTRGLRVPPPEMSLAE